MNRRIGVVLVTLGVGAVLLSALVTGSGPARPTSVTPADGAALATGPVEVSLAFTPGQPPTAVHLGVTGPEGQSVTSGPLRQTEDVATVAVTLTQDGAYLVAFHVVLADGSEVLGDSRFSVGAPGSSTVEPQAAPKHSHLTDDPLNIVFLAVDLALLIALAVLFRPRRRRRVSDPEATKPGATP